MNKSDLLQQCCALIEQKLGWGDSVDWQNQDFETLSTRIFDETQVVLSVSTLKRVWGKVKYDSLPSLTTLNTLAVFAGFSNWRQFSQQHSGETAVAVAEEAPAITPPRPVRKSHNAFWFLLPGIVTILALAGWMYNRPSRALETSYRFSSEPLAKGIPNSVIFRYDAAAAGEDSVFIQQSWDARRRFPVPANGHTYTSMYYYPGFFKAKLIVDGEIVREHGLLIPSEGWLAAAEQQPVPVYFTPAEVRCAGALQVTPELLAGKNLPLQPAAPEIRFYNIGDMQGLQNDNFMFETEVKSNYGQGAAVCRQATVVLHSEGSAMMVPLGIPGCVAEMGLFIFDKEFNAKSTDLSGFGCNMQEWVKLRCEVRNKTVRIWVNGNLAYTYPFTAPAARLVGVSYRFHGPAAVNSVKLARLNGQAVLEDTFE